MVQLEPKKGDSATPRKSETNRVPALLGKLFFFERNVWLNFYPIRQVICLLCRNGTS